MNAEEARRKSNEANEKEFQKALDKIQEAAGRGLTHTDIGCASDYTTSKLIGLGYKVKSIDYTPPSIDHRDHMLEELHQLILW